MGRKPSKNLNLPARMRARQRGEKTWYYYDTGGKPRREIPLGSDYVLAVQKWAELNMSAAPVAATVSWAVAQYLASTAFNDLATGTQADYKYAIAEILEHFGDAPLDAVTPPHLVAYHEARSKGTLTRADGAAIPASKHRAKREVEILGRIFKYARSMGWTKNDPKADVELRRLPGRKHVYIEDDLYRAVYDKGGVVLREACDIAYLLGQRPIDVLRLREPKDGEIELRQTKTKAPIRIAVAGPLAVVLERIAARKKTLPFRMIDGPLLVDERGRAMTKHKLRARFEAAREAAGVSGDEYQFRDLRAKAATDLRDAVSLEASQALLGHASITMTEHYTRARRGKVIHHLPSMKSVPQKTKTPHG